jgi:hypothetical protein
MVRFLRSFGTGDLVFPTGMGGAGPLHSEPAVRREDFRAAKFPGSLPRPPAVKQVLVHAQREHGGKPVALILPECGLDVFRGVVLRGNLAVLDHAEVAVVGDQRRHNRLAGAVDDLHDVGLQPGDVADGPQRETAQLANAFRDGIGHGKKLLGMLIEQQMMTTASTRVV